MYYTYDHLLHLKWIAVLYRIDQFWFWIYASRHSKVMAFFPESCMKKGKWWPAICNYKQPYKNLCASSTKLKQSWKDSLCYSKSINVHFQAKQTYITGIVNLLCLRNDTKESWTVSSTTVILKIICCWHLAPPFSI